MINLYKFQQKDKGRRKIYRITVRLQRRGKANNKILIIQVVTVLNRKRLKNLLISEYFFFVPNKTK
jgi:hypothetical protein